MNPPEGTTPRGGEVVSLIDPARLAHRGELRHVSHALASLLGEIQAADTIYTFGCVSAEDRGADADLIVLC